MDSGNSSGNYVIVKRDGLSVWSHINDLPSQVSDREIVSRRSSVEEAIKACFDANPMPVVVQNARILSPHDAIVVVRSGKYFWGRDGQGVNRNKDRVVRSGLSDYSATMYCWKQNHK